MKLRIRFALLVVSFHFAGSAFAAHGAPTGGVPGSFGLGVVLGEPTGISAKAWSDPRHAWDFGLAYSFNDYLLLWADYLWHFPGGFTGISPALAPLTPYVGVGPEVFISSTGTRAADGVHDGKSAGVAARIPLGMEWVLRSAPVGFFLELVPAIGLVPAVDAFFQGGIGARFYFK